MPENVHSQMTLEAIRSVPLFASLDNAAATALRELLEVRSARAGTRLFPAGSGGDFFGEMALLDGKPRSADATVVEDARLAVLTREDFLDFVRANPDVALHMLGAITERLRRTDDLLRQRVSRNVNEVDEEQKTFADRMADALSNFGGSWPFILLTVFFVAGWMVFNSWLLADRGLDPFPYSFLDVINGIVAALIAPVILISQNRQREVDRLRSDIDFSVNLKNELALAELTRRLDVLESERLPVLFQEQNARIAEAIRRRE